MCKSNLRNWVGGMAAAALCVAMAGIPFAPNAAASEWNKKTIVTFSGPVEIPGKALGAGTYVFKLMDSPSNRNIVQIYDKDEQLLITTVLAVPDYRLRPTGKTVINFDERPSNSPEAVKAWFYPGDMFGQQFVYPHQQAMKIAKRTNQDVLATREDNGQVTKTTEVTGVNPQGETVDVNTVVQSSPSK